MNLAGTEYTLKHKSFDIFVSGCTHKCKGCFNPETWDFNYGEKLDADYLCEKILNNRDMIEKIRIMGGDLCCQNEEEAFDLVNKLSWLEIPIEVYTGCTKEELDKSEFVWLYDICSAIKFGRFVLDKRVTDNRAEYYGSSNQEYWIKTTGGWRRSC